MGGRALAVLLAIAVLGAATSAHAYVRSTVTDDPSTPLFWRYRTVLVRPAPYTSDDLADDEVRAALGRSIATWNEAALDCSDFRIVDDGPPTGLRTNLDGGEHDGQNRIVFREDSWPGDMGPRTLALTTTVYRRSTGEILDADIDLNGVHHTWTTTDDPFSAESDAENTLTHELGHLLGLAHAPDPDSTMYPESDVGDLSKRSLAEDDIAGLCFIYPSGRLTPGASPTSSGSLTSCAIGPMRGPTRAGRWPLAVLPMLLAWLALRRRAH